MRDLYEILGIEKTSTKEEIKKAYRRLAKKYHPDVYQGEEDNHEIIKEINLAYEVLSDPEKRSNYDRYGEASFQNGGMGQGGFNMDFSDLFGDIFDMFGGGFSQRSGRNRGPIKGSDIQEHIYIDFMEAVFGCEREISIKRSVKCHTCDGSGAMPGSGKNVCDKCNGSGQVRYQQSSPFGTFVRTATCDKCGGSGEVIEKKCDVCDGSGMENERKTISVKIPAGVDEGSVISLRAEGNAGSKGGPNGDLFLIVHVKEHEFFKRSRFDVYYTLPISFAQATLGATIDVPVLDGIEEFQLPEGTTTGSHFRLNGKGIPYLQRKGRGDIIFDVQIVTPKNITDKQKELLLEFDRESNGNIKLDKHNKKSIFEKIKDMFE